jgi:hypothetical protein
MLAFNFFQEPRRNLVLAQRIDALAAFHTFLGQEYQRICANNLPGVSIQAFRQQFNPVHFTDENVIDSLLGAFVALLRKSGVTNGTIIYR